MTNPHGNFPSKNIKIREEKENQTPTGTPKEILAWVGEDLERAQRALDQELATSKPRKSIVEPLKGILS